MTERLSSLMHAEADVLDVPEPRTREVLAQGRTIRRRRRWASGVAVAAAIAVVSTGALVATNRLGADRASDRIDPATAAYLEGGAYAVGSTIHVGSQTVTLDEKVKSLYYTSAGVLVRTGDTAHSDDPGPSHYSLVRPDGEVSTLDLDLGDRVPSTDPESPYLAYGDADREGWKVVVRDVDDDTEMARVPVPGDFSWGGWLAPPVALAGDDVYVGMDEATYGVDWRTGQVREVVRLHGGGAPDVQGGHALAVTRSGVTVYDTSTGADLLEVQIPGYGYVELSPDGRFAKLTMEEVVDGNGDIQPAPEKFIVYDVESGEHTTVDEASWDFGWTPDGHLLKVGPDAVTTCDPVSGACDSVSVDNGKGQIKLGGKSYES